MIHAHGAERNDFTHHDDRAPDQDRDQDIDEPIAPGSAEAWDARYRTRDALWSADPNPILVAEAGRLSAGRALEAGCGEGADGVWLAAQGWDVTGIDLSPTAIERARTRGDSAGVSERLTWIAGDASAVVPTLGAFDLVSSQYTHPPSGIHSWVRMLADAVAPGGSLLVVGHHPQDPHTLDHPHLAPLAWTAEDAAQALDPRSWTITAERRDRTSTEPGGPERHWRDAVLVAVRR